MGLITVKLVKEWIDEDNTGRIEFRTVKVPKTAEMRVLERQINYQRLLAHRILGEISRLKFQLEAHRSQEAVKHEASLGHDVEGWR